MKRTQSTGMKLLRVNHYTHSLDLYLYCLLHWRSLKRQFTIISWLFLKTKIFLLIVHGFCNKRSTKLPTTLFCGTIHKEISNGNLVESVYIDLSKAFDTISHSMLIKKMKPIELSVTNWYGLLAICLDNLKLML